jgi:UDP-N-acetylmuramoyl-L-alanyl-D-glutamate--2,6-diaminopimelate ligase
MEDYFATKAALFTPKHSRRGVVVVDDHWGRRLAEQAAVPVRTLAVAPDEPDHPVVQAATWRVRSSAVEGTGSRAELVGPDGVVVDLRVPMPGLVNVANGALTVALAAELGIPPAQAAQALADAPMVAGRMELVSAGRHPMVVVDYAHSPDALRTALATLRSGAPEPLVVVVGAGGDRDTSKREPMGRVAATGADLVVVTDDNPRSEAPHAIRASVLSGARGVDAARVMEVPDRADAIATAIRLAGSGTVLVAGKGHEQGQEVAGVVHPFDDRSVARAALATSVPARDEQ